MMDFMTVLKIAEKDTVVANGSAYTLHIANIFLAVYNFLFSWLVLFWTVVLY